MLKTVKWNMVLAGLLTLVAGVAILIHPDDIASTIMLMIGIILLVAGAISILSFIRDKSSGVSSYGDIIIGVIELAIGLVLTIKPESFVAYIGYVFAVMLFIHGIYDVMQTFTSRRIKDPYWYVPLIIGFVSLAFAVVIFIDPFAAARTLMIIAGIALITDGAADLVIALRTGGYMNRFNKAAASRAARQAAEQAELEAGGLRPGGRVEAPEEEQ